MFLIVVFWKRYCFHYLQIVFKLFLTAMFENLQFWKSKFWNFQFSCDVFRSQLFFKHWQLTVFWICLYFAFNCEFAKWKKRRCDFVRKNFVQTRIKRNCQQRFRYSIIFFLIMLRMLTAIYRFFLCDVLSLRLEIDCFVFECFNSSLRIFYVFRDL